MSSLRLLVVSAFLVAAAGCGSSSPSTPASPSPTPPTSGGTASSVSIPAGAESLGNRAYSPDSLIVAVGSTVTWTNTDRIAHTSTSDGHAFHSGTVQPGGHYSFTFQSAGTFTYHCSIHPGMVGAVTVVE